MPQENDKIASIQRLLEENKRLLNSESLVRDKELNSLLNDAVLRGDYHMVKTILSLLNPKLPAETLKKTENISRIRKEYDLDKSGSFYPIQMEPKDWFKALEPNLIPKDYDVHKEDLRELTSTDICQIVFGRWKV